MDGWKKLLEVADRLLGARGCAWHHKQTLSSLEPYLLEEAHELIEAIDLKNSLKIKEELADVLYALIFIAKVAEKEGLFTLEEALFYETEKLIRRHPHVFGKEKLESAEEIARSWEETKKKEGKKSPIEGIPPSLPALSRAQKIVHKLQRTGQIPSIEEFSIDSEEEVGELLWDLVRAAEKAGFNAEGCLRRKCLEEEEKHRR